VTVGKRDLSALATYEAFAHTYEAFNHAYRYEQWTGRLLAKAQQCGLTGDRLLDVGCGTGLSFVAMLDRGWRVTACDISPAMIEVARARVGSSVDLRVADMRGLARLGEFDLVWAVNDAMNYLLGIEELQEALAAMSANLRRGGVLLFDLNTLLAYATFCCGDHPRRFEGRQFVWHGRARPKEVRPGTIFEAALEIDGRIDHVHRQRHFAQPEVLAAIAGAGLSCVAVSGELEGELQPTLDEGLHTKAVYVCRSRATTLPLGGGATG
jgi:SAM-dependent methyltransferase